jgi:hypothetical protein
MEIVKDLSPLAFEIAKYLCNSSDTDSFQQMNNETLDLGSQEAFNNAIEELKNKKVIIAQQGSNNTLLIKIDPDSNVCDELDYLLDNE